MIDVSRRIPKTNNMEVPNFELNKIEIILFQRAISYKLERWHWVQLM